MKISGLTLPTNAFPTVEVRPTLIVCIPANATYKIRRAAFLRYTLPGFKVTGVLEIREQRDWMGKITRRRYALQELDYEGGRRFRLSKPLGSAAADEDSEHFVLLAEPKPGEVDWCSPCMGFERHGRCAHILAVRQLHRAGFLPPHAGCRQVSPAALPAACGPNEGPAVSG